ncbi:SAM-dependent methyltransferase [Pseudonocardia nematodicida]|uniref:SAM-dependent methyltransferase n=1 Tax=Pseudonocardia nematodicida TaxID=1206997 RepID=A0ABV1KH67_9PSEU
MSERSVSGGEAAAAESPDLTRPNAARAYDHLLGGSHNFAIDREFADRVATAYPGAVSLARAHRRFLQIAVRHCVDSGIDQFLDLGSGLPTVGSVHETAWERNPAARVAYVDAEPVAAAYGRDLLGDTELATVTRADLRRPDDVLAAPGVAGLLDFERPIALMLIGVLHFVSGDDDPAGIIARYTAALAEGSVLILAQSSADHPEHPELARAVTEANARYAGTSTPGYLRSRAEITALFDGWELAEPGLLDVGRWPAEQRDGDPLGGYGGITRPLVRG